MAEAIFKLDVLQSMQNMEYLGNLDPKKFKNEVITFNRLNTPRGTENEPDILDKSNENNWRVGLLFEKSDSSLVNLSIGQFVNATLKKNNKLTKMTKMLSDTAKNDGDVKFDASFKFKVIDVPNLQDSNKKDRYARSAYTAYRDELNKAKADAVDADTEFIFAKWVCPQSILDGCTGKEGLIEGAVPMRTLVLEKV